MLCTKGWQQLVESIKNCKACKISESRNLVVIERGSRRAKWFIIGEAPGAEEDMKGIPFVGSAGEVLDNIVDSFIPLEDRCSVYVTNSIKCRPPRNRKPDALETNNCFPFLRAQISLVNPLVIITMGHTAFNSLLGGRSVGSVRQKLHLFNGIPVIATYHPAYLLRVPRAKREVQSDFWFALSIITLWEHYNLGAVQLALGS